MGEIRVQGSVSGSDTEWFYVNDAISYEGYTNTDYMNVEGYFPYLRMEFASSGGTVDKVLVR
jgi:hypothetical protein